MQDPGAHLITRSETFARQTLHILDRQIVFNGILASAQCLTVSNLRKAFVANSEDLRHERSRHPLRRLR